MVGINKHVYAHFCVLEPWLQEVRLEDMGYVFVFLFFT